MCSDERLKELFGSDDIVKLFSQFNVYEFKYAPEALKLNQLILRSQNREGK